MAKITVITDFNISGGSGYYNLLATPLIELTARGHEILVLGLGYKGEEHNFPYKVIPIPRDNFIPKCRAMVNNLKIRGIYQDVLLVAIDLNIQEQMLDALAPYDQNYIGLFPKEAGPLTVKWTRVISRMRRSLVTSRFGVEMCKEQGLNTELLTATVDPESWRPPSREERAKLRAVMGIPENAKVAMTTAANQERKNLPAAFKAARILKDKYEDFFYILVTGVQSYAGWSIDDLKRRHEIQDCTLVFDKGEAVDFKRLWALYAISDVLLMSSKAEGVCMPVLECMSMGVPVAAPNHTSFAEHLADGRGFLADIQYVDEGVFGNEFRYFVNPESLAQQAEHAIAKSSEEGRDLLGCAERKYITDRTWKGVTDEIESCFG